MKTPKLCWLVAALWVIFPCYIFAQSSGCTTSASGQISCTLSGNFSTTNQSMFAPGTGSVTFSTSAGTSWDQSGSAGSIADVSFEGADLGNNGAEVSGSTSGNIGVSANLIANGGTVDATVPAAAKLTISSSSVHPGDQFTVTSSLSYGGAQFSTQSPSVAFGVSLGFSLQASVGATACAAGSCTGFTANNFINTGPQSLTLLSYNEQGSSSSPQLGGGAWVALGQDVSSEISGQLSGSKDIIPTVLALNWNVDPTNLSFTTKSTPSGSGTFTSSGMTASAIAGLDLNLTNAIARVADIPPLSGNLGDFACSDLGVPCSSDVQNLLNEVSYDIVSADATLGVSPSQQYSMKLNGAAVGLQVVDQNGSKIGGVVPLNANGSATLTYPTMAANGKQITKISIVPTLELNDPTFTTATGLTLVPGFNVSALSLNLDSTGLSVGPLFSWDAPIPASPQLTLATQTFGLGGFNSVSLPSNSDPTIGANTAVQTGSLGASDTQTINFETVDATGKSLNYQNLTITDSDITRGDFSDKSSTSTLTIGDNPSFGQTVIDGSTFHIGSTTLTTNGNVLFESVRVDGQAGGTVDVQSQSPLPATLTANNTVFDSLNLRVEAGSTVNLTNNSQFSGEITVDKASSGLPAGMLNVTNSSVILAAGAPVSVEAGSLSLTGASRLDVNSTLFLTGTMTAGDGTTINVNSGGLLTGEGTVKLSSATVMNVAGNLSGNNFANNVNLTIDNNGGTLNFENGSGPAFVTIQNPQAQGGGGGVPGGVVNFSGAAGIASTNITGMSAVNINTGEDLQMTLSSISATTILNNGKLESIYIGGPPNPSGAQNQVTGNFINNGAVTVSYICNGSCGSKTVSFSNFTNQGGAFYITATTTADVTSQFSQTAGVATVDGTLMLANGSAAQVTGGTISGTGTIAGSVNNIAGTIAPGDPAGVLTISGGLDQGGAATLLVDVNSLTDFSQLDVSGNVNLSGTLEVVLDDAFLSQFDTASGLQNFLGTSFDFLNFGSLSGGFTNFDFVTSADGALPFGYTWDVDEAPGSLFIVWSQIPDCSAAGKALLSGDKQPTSCTKWPGGTGLGPSAFHPPGIILTSPSPEPASLLLFGTGLLALAWAAKKRRGRLEN
ncbi:MAG: PEP-CTERM sorting domain-containing protein [Acidobacteriota bacterium]|nr:PEP-CTERM sorting domain-containing protein [Acidobacteriota bacterium]